MRVVEGGGLTLEIGEEVVAEIWLGGAMFAEIRSEGGTFLVEVYNRRENGPWSLQLVTLLDALGKAKRELRPDSTYGFGEGTESPSG